MSKKNTDTPDMNEKNVQQTESNSPRGNAAEPSENEILKQQIAEKEEQLMRIAAEYDNFRKRSMRERECIYSDVKVSVLSDLLTVLDAFERAQTSEAGTLEDYKKGVDMIFSQFMDVMAKLGVEQFGEEGDSFDPSLHNAIMHIEDETKDENTVVTVFQKGYKIGDKVIRHAMVQVAN